MGAAASADDLYARLLPLARQGDPDAGGLLSINYVSGEHITGFTEGRPLFARNQDAAFTLENGGAEVNWIPTPGEANLAVTQTVAPVPAAAGTRLTYQITVTNGGPLAAAGVVLNAEVPLGATDVLTSTPQGACTTGPIGVSCALGTMPAGGVSHGSARSPAS